MLINIDEVDKKYPSQVGSVASNTPSDNKKDGDTAGGAKYLGDAIGKALSA